MSAPASVLLVEPDADNCDMYAESLAFQGFHVLTATTGADALRVLGAVDVVVTSIRLNGSMDGVELVERVRAKDAHKPILIVTASVSPADRTRVEGAGADVFLAKPCLPDALSNEIRRLLTIKRVA